MPPEICPNCGTVLESKDKACPECGSDEQTGWSESAKANRLGLPDEDFDHGEFVKEEFSPAPRKPHGISWFWWVIALLLIATFLLFILR